MNQSYNNYDECVESELQNSLVLPVDNDDLYAKRLYDNQLARDSCYKKRPIRIEGFDGGNGDNGSTFKTIIGVLIFIVAVVLIIALIFSLCKSSHGAHGTVKVIHVGIPNEPLTASA